MATTSSSWPPTAARPSRPRGTGNLEADPDVGVQLLGDRFRARARTATPEERPGLWQAMAAIWPAYDRYQERTDREIPVVVLERD